MLEPTPGPGLVGALTRIASDQAITGKYGAAIETANRTLELADGLGLEVPGDALATRGWARCYLGDLAGLADLERALDLLTAAGQGRSAATLLHNLACVRWALEGPASAVATLDEAIVFSNGRGLAESVQIHHASRSVFLVDAGRFDEGLAEAASIVPILRENGNRLFEHDALTGQAVSLDERGEDAVEPAERALEIARGTGDAAYLAFATWAVAPALLTAGRNDEARELLGAVADSPGHDHAEYGHHLPRLVRTAFALEDDDLLARLVAGVPSAVPRQQHALVTVRAIRQNAPATTPRPLRSTRRQQTAGSGSPRRSNTPTPCSARAAASPLPAIPAPTSRSVARVLCSSRWAPAAGCASATT